MILQTQVPYDIFSSQRLPGTRPLDFADWLITDEAYAAQMAERARLLREDRNAVLAVLPECAEAAEETLDLALAHLPDGVTVTDGVLQCPDGRSVPIDRSDPLGTLGHALQEDFCVMQKQGDEYVLTGAVLCFPSIWRLHEKLGRPMTVIHEPVKSYDGDIARRVARLFDGLNADRPIWRFNARWHEHAQLFQPWSEVRQRDTADRGAAPYMRSERQSLLRLPRSGAVLFTIHTFVLTRADAERQRSGQEGGNLL
ncbi:MAG: DUF3445 domain-containing protein [Roseivivax sp.]|nr:DUF3445 domain-containing protein [Roseivivax sp.]